MDILIRKHFYDKCLWTWHVSPEKWLELLRNPLVEPEKEKAPLGIYGTLVQSPTTLLGTGVPQYLGSNIASLYYLQLDYDSTLSIDEWMADHKALSYVLYTSHSHGYKGDHDRFRVIVPLEKQLDCDMQDIYFKKAMVEEWGCDPSCFDRGHCQLLPVIREKGATYRFEVNRAHKFSIDWKKVDTIREKAHLELDFNHACIEFARRFMPQRSRSEEEQRMLAWACRQLDDMKEGERNATSFAVLSYLRNQGFDYMCVDALAEHVGQDFIGEFMKMAVRIL